MHTILEFCDLSELSYGTCACHSEDEHSEMSVSHDFIWSWFFNDSIGRHVFFKGQCLRLNYALTFLYNMHKMTWYRHRRVSASIEPRWMDVQMCRWDERHVGPFSMTWPSELWWPMTSQDLRWCPDHMTIWIRN